MTITCIILRGAGDQVGNPNSPPWWIANRLDRERFEIQEVEYPASIGPVNSTGSQTGISLHETERRTMPMIDDMVRATPNLVLGIGYSLGAYMWSRWFARRPPDCIVPWATLIANPLRPDRISHDVIGAPGFGLAGQRERIPGVDIREIAHPEDGITCCPWDSRLRTVADIVDPLSFALGGGWFQGLAEKTMRGDWQKVLTSWRPGMPLPDPGEFALRYWRSFPKRRFGRSQAGRPRLVRPSRPCSRV
jgi:hypothetical protein